MTNPTQQQKENAELGPETLARVLQESLIRKEVLRGVVADEAERLKKLDACRRSVEDLSYLLTLADKTPRGFDDGLRTLRDGAAAYFFAAENGDGVTRGFFKWEWENCRPVKLFHADAIGQIQDPARKLRAVLMTPAGAGLASAQEYLLYLEAAPGISYPYASRHGQPVEVPLDAFEFVFA